MSTSTFSTITTTINNCTYYVAKKTYRHSSGNKVIVTHTPDVNKARQFDHRRQARDFIQKIVNHTERAYSVDTTIVQTEGAAQTEKAAG